MILSEIYIYPVKSLAGIALSESFVEQRGLRYDRRWMIVDEKWQFLTQRELPQMATISTAIIDDSLQLSFPKIPEINVPLVPESTKSLQVEVWDSKCEAMEVSDEANRWFSEVLGIKSKLVFMPDSTRRKINPKYAISGEGIVSFADGEPFLLTTEESLADLNSRLAEPVPMNRFRPNFVVRGVGSFAEDSWKMIQIGGLKFRVVKLCGRCVMITVDQKTGKFTGKEPLKTLSTFRTKNNQVLFGQKLVGNQEGIVRIGDEIKILEEK